MPSEAVYMDHAATTGVHPEVLEAMLPYLGPQYGNPSSAHQLGQAARRAVSDARERVAQVLRCSPSEITFTSCGTESINLGIKGIMKAAGGTGHIITTAIEHHAVLHTVEQLEREGHEVSVLPVSPEGIVDPEQVSAAIRPDTRLISVMYANNEIGTLQPVQTIAQIARDRDVAFHSDCVQAAGALSIDVQDLGVTSLALSGHKFYAPKGVGIMYLREGTMIETQQQGGGQEHGNRAGTENVPYIVGIAVALERAHVRRDAYNAHCAALRDLLLDGLLRAVPHSRVNGHQTKRLPNNAHLSFRGVEAQAILMGLDLKSIYASSGSACVSASLEPSHVLTAIGVPRDYIYGSVRLSVGEATTREHVARVLNYLPPLVRRLQALSPVAAAS
ncbi:MAG: aminotransferase class V-fold PLP-dependent enzyme [Chloroflexia bacterium]|nr:aminotransferase class V-fold PLP-dependent enzyme [Chloroflexia bacterium]